MTSIVRRDMLRASATVFAVDQAQAILDTYLEAAKFSNGRVNSGYLTSLGLAAP